MTSAFSFLTRSKPQRRWFRFSLRTFLLLNIAMVLASAWVGNVLARVHQQRRIVRQLEANGHTVYFDYQVGSNYASEPPGPWLVRCFLGDDFFATVTSVDFRSETTRRDFQVLLELPRLNWLTIESEQIDTETLSRVAQIPELKLLVLAITGEAGIDLTPLQAATHLESLFLTGPGIGDKDLAPLADFPNLKSLRMSATSVTELGLQSIRRVSKLRTLEFYESADIGDAAFAQLVGMTQLEELTVSLIKPSDEGGAVKSLPTSTGSPITDTGMMSLARLPQLRYVFLPYTSVTNAGLLELKSLKHLETLHVCGTLTPAGHGALQKHLPKCQITCGDLLSGEMFP